MQTLTLRFCGCYMMLCILLIAGCNRETKSVLPADFTLRKFVLQDSLAEIELSLPQKMDTFFEWVDVSDDACDDLKKYRFTCKKCNAVAETGYFKEPLIDSVYRFTAYHVNNFRCKFDTKQPDSFDLGRWYMRMEVKYGQQDTNDDPIRFVLVDSGKIRINGRLFVEESYTVEDPSSSLKYSSTTLQAFTVIDSSMFLIEYECCKPDCNGFIEEMKKSLATLKIREIKK